MNDPIVKQLEILNNTLAVTFVIFGVILFLLTVFSFIHLFMMAYVNNNLNDLAQSLRKSVSNQDTFNNLPYYEDYKWPEENERGDL